ncbi:MAG: hypothetical protein F4W93_13310 [Dehalococcoidia bacterium]|nr:hypothetical protein [Dehalococcoidia bacterium]
MRLLKELGISSPQEAAELERDLGISFNDLTHDQRETWKQQTVYLGLYAETGTYTRAAHSTGITVRTVRTWQSENTLGFNDRLELAVLEYSEGIDLMLHQHVRKPDCSPSLLMMFVRAQFPEKYGPVRRDNAPRNTNRCDHQCDHDPQPPTTSRYDLQLLEEIFRDLQNLKQFAGLSEPDFTPPNPSPVLGEGWGEGNPPSTENPEPAVQNPGPSLQNLDPNLPPTDHVPVEAGSKPDYDSTTPSVESPPTPSPVLGEGWGEGEPPGTENPEPAVQNPTPSTQNPTSLHPSVSSVPSVVSPPPRTQNLAPNTQNLTRRQRRELQRRAKRRKSHLARAPN